MNNKIINYTFGLLLTINSAFSYALDAPVKDIEVKLFSYRALLSVYDFNYANIVQRQRSAAKMFTGTGWAAFQTALLKSKLIESVRTNQYTVSTVPLAPPKIVKEGLQGQSYFWDVKMPAMVIYKNATFKQVQYLNINIHIIYERGLRAGQFLAETGTPINCQKDGEVDSEAPK